MVFAQWFSDPIGSMSGPTFLIFYTILFVVGMMALRRRVKSLNAEANARPSLRMPEKLDPYKVAFLRGGDSEVLRAAMVDLVDRGLITKTEVTQGRFVKTKLTQWVSDPEKVSQGYRFSAIQEYLIEHFHSAKDAASIFGAECMLKARGLMGGYRDWVQEEQLLNDHSGRAGVRSMAWMLFLGLEGIGLYKLIAAIATRHFNVMFLLGYMAIIPIVILVIVARRRLSERGKRFLSDVQSACRSVKILKSVELHRRSEVNVLASDSTLPLLAMGVFGVAALQGSSLDPMYRSYQKSVANMGGCGATSGGCGSGCGASVSGTAGCGSAGDSCGGAGAGCGGAGAGCGGGGGCGGCGGGGCGGD